MEMSCLLHRGIWQHHRVIAIKIKSSFKSLVRNYELKSRTLGLEFRDLEKPNESWSHPNVNATAVALQLEQQAGCWCRRTTGNKVALGTSGTGHSSVSSGWCWEEFGAYKAGGWTWLSWPWASLCCAVTTQGGGKGTDAPMRDRVETHPWLPIPVMPVAGSDVGQFFPFCPTNVLF